MEYIRLYELTGQAHEHTYLIPNRGYAMTNPAETYFESSYNRSGFIILVPSWNYACLCGGTVLLSAMFVTVLTGP